MRRHKHIGLYVAGPRRRYFTGPVDDLLTGIGIGGETAANLAPVVSGGVIGAGVGAGVGALTGGNVGEAALIGGGVGALGGVGQDFGVVPSFPGETTGANFAAPTTDIGTLATPTGTIGGATPSGVSAVGAAGSPALLGGDPTQLTSEQLLAASPGGGGGINNTAAGSGGLNTALFGDPSTTGAGRVSSGGQLINDVTGGNFGAVPGDLGKVALNNPGALLAGGGLLYDLSRNQNVPGQSQLSGEAAQLSAQGKQLSSYLNSGMLPKGAQTAIDLATKSVEASIRSKYASMGIPPNSTMEIQDINNARQQAAVQGFQIANSLLKTGIDETALSAQIYNDLIQINQRQAAATGQAISSFAAALSGFNPAGGNTIRLG